ncbi:MAG: nucleoside triphosphate pyrophosphohydrolase [Nitrospirae bacterium]|nr:nucleoside triphosphate pyrophosphohydrolase [Nitrospirota bacterium]
MHIKKLIEIAEKLRSPEGCPWDREQTRDSLKPFLVEEMYELIDAMNANDPEGIKEELGDLLFQIVLHCQLSKEEGLFDIEDVAEGIAYKMVSRHPHVFGDKDFKTSEEVRIWWDEHKKKEGKTTKSALDRVPKTLPALSMAKTIQKKATKVGFDWENIGDVFKKLDEEVEEFKGALNGKSHSDIESELGDMLFVMVRLANFVNVDSEIALRKTIKKFISRFNHIEAEASKQDHNLNDMTLEEMETLWNAAKKIYE